MSDITRLVLTRKVHQSINIGGLITVTVEEIHGRTVRISVQAPRGIAVHRQEIYERIFGGGEGGGDEVGFGPLGIEVSPLARPVSRAAGGPRAVAARGVAIGAAAGSRAPLGPPPGEGGDPTL